MADKGPLDNPIFKKLWKLREDHESQLPSTENITDKMIEKGGFIVPGLTDIAEYQRADCLTRMIVGAMTGTILGGTAGLFQSMFYVPEQVDRYSKVEAAALTKLNTSSAIFTRPMFWCTLVSVTYTGASCVAEYVRDADRTSPWYNGAIGGAAAGMVMGAAVKRFDVGAVCALTAGMVSFAAKLDEAYRNEARLESHTIFTDTYEKKVTEKTLKEQYPEYKDM
mmetsp:Transcript_26047/g.71743  ORF Transcript_26047/g.71743 Transcript_26047/m.71743 type:complete len:223 (+) Transcript_26047:107-775(+)|eukprot:CAMPEP_0168740616 /NCGR_PEP_ID=MMETSP0724-20121128/12080_1 /TAXON_ID=265536 /ORGANISM="Amphiprora sp., Strain CCMP467" /LENGTH=222 /DNA_ID=CAMNT_0008788075 /DNA_START=67 /DNA_END=735 /DNA_ORIENTATION=-